MNAVRGGSTSGVALTLNGLNGKFDDALSWALGAGDAAGSGWGGFFVGTYTNADRDSTDRESGYNTDMWDVTGGIDYSWSQNLLLGVAFSYNEAESDISANGGDLLEAYPLFFENSVHPYIAKSVRILETTEQGREIVDNLYANLDDARQPDMFKAAAQNG